MRKGSLDQAISFYKSGNRRAASEVLTKLLKKEPKNEAAWLWLSACVESNEQKLYCLRKVLEINPDNLNAKAAIHKLMSPVLPDVDQIVSIPQATQKKTNTKQSLSQTANITEQEIKLNRTVNLLGAIGFLILMIACLIMLVDNTKPTQQTIKTKTVTQLGTEPKPTVQQPTKPPTPTQRPSEEESLVVKSGTLSQYEGQFSRDTVVNVYKSNGTLQLDREDDLKQLCLDWLFYRAKIFEYVAKGQTEEANEARAAFKDINRWLDEYNEDDVQRMFSIIEKNNWSNW